MQLSILENRLLHRLPEKYEKAIEEEFSRFEMESSRLSNEPDKHGQATLTKHEIQRATTTNQNGDYGHTVVELQAIKGVAMSYGIDDWLSYIDPKLTYEENMDIIETKANPTMKVDKAKEKSQKRWM